MSPRASSLPRRPESREAGPTRTAGNPAFTGGFTLLELVLVAAILVSLAAVAIPMLGGAREAREARALHECGAVGEALARYMEDTRFRPTGPGGSPEIDALTSDVGTLPDLAGGATGLELRPLRVVTRENTWDSPRWRGPYLDVQHPDPWGHRYVAWVRNYHSPDTVWILSAGPDGVLQTGPGASEPRGDDLGVGVQ